jgi:hypothetical protein
MYCVGVGAPIRNTTYDVNDEKIINNASTKAALKSLEKI